jgi:hypothetical protein
LKAFTLLCCTFVFTSYFLFAQKEDSLIQIDSALIKTLPFYDLKIPDYNSYKYVLPQADTDTTLLNQRPRFLLDSINQVNAKLKLMDGFRILLYQGTDKEASLKAKEQAYKLLPNSNIYTAYKQPNYRVKLGDFTDRLEAYRVKEKILSKTFPNAIIIQDNVFIKP